MLGSNAGIKLYISKADILMIQINTADLVTQIK